MDMNSIMNLVLPETLNTLYMVFFSTVFSLIIGLPLGVILTVTRPEGIAENKGVFSILDGIINIMRSIPFIILMIIVLPLSKIFVGTTIGSTAVIVPLTISAAPFVARIMESSFMEVDKGVIEAAKSMGSSNWQIVSKVLIPEAMPSIVNSITMTIINIIGYSAMAGTIGGGGLGNLAIRYGHFRRVEEVLFVAVVVIIVIVQIVQWTGTRLSNAINKK